MANTCNSIISSQTVTNFKHTEISFQSLIHKSDIITGQGITKPMILYELCNSHGIPHHELALHFTLFLEFFNDGLMMVS